MRVVQPAQCAGELTLGGGVATVQEIERRTKVVIVGLEACSPAWFV
jgi:hypothetical protein